MFCAGKTGFPLSLLKYKVTFEIKYPSNRERLYRLTFYLKYHLSSVLIFNMETIFGGHRIVYVGIGSPFS